MPPNTIQTVSAIAAVDLANELVERGFIDRLELSEISSVLAELYQCHQQGLSITEKRVAEYDFLSLWSVADKQTSLPSLGLEIGQTVNVNAKGMLANWISCCDTLNQGFSIFQKNIRLLNQAEYWSTAYQGEHVKLTFEFRSEFDYPTMAVERSMVALLSWADYFSAQKLDVQAASFTFDKPNHSVLYNAIFGSSIRFNSAENSVELLTSQLNTPLNSANPYLRNLIEERSEKIDLDLSPSHNIKTKVENLLRSDLIKYCNLEATLNTLHMSRTTLYRKLKEERSIFSELVLTERKSLLARIDPPNTDSEELAEVLGFKDVSSYYKFLKRTKS